MGEFKMPSLGPDMEAGTLVKWTVKPGDEIHRGDIVAEVESDKGLIEIEVFEDGTVKELCVDEGVEVPVGTVLAVIGESDVSTPAARHDGARVDASPPSQVEALPSARAKASPPVRVKASPLARRIATERGIDLRSVRGTGVDGAIVREDVEKASPGDAPVAPREPERVRSAIAAAMARANREIPHYYLETHIDMSRALRWLASENQKSPIEKRLLPVALLLKAVASSVAETPELNGYWIDGALQPSAVVHVGVAIALRQGGLVTPAVHDVERMSVQETMEALSDLIRRARAGRLKSSELADATITVTNLGDLGVETVHGVIYPPQVALVGFGKIVDRPWAQDGMLGVRPIVSATLAGDHRASDGRRGAQFLDAMNERLQRPETL